MALIRTDVRDRVAVVTLDDPGRRNAISLAMNDELVAAMDELEERDDVGAIVVTGAGSAFCAGAELGELQASADEEGLRRIYAGFLRVTHARVPTIAAVNGPAVGAGINLALACDVILAARSARFDTRFLQLGIHPGGGHTWRLRRITDAQTVMAMVLFGEALDGEAAARHGVAWRCVEDADLLDAAREMAARAAAAPPMLARRVKATIASLERVHDSEGAVAHELDPQVWSMRQPAFRELVARWRARISGGKR
ncbi:MAG TPA: enoyl-CoA hydratase-related protein [Acidimicrobiales bacterium]